MKAAHPSHPPLPVNSVPAYAARLSRVCRDGPCSAMRVFADRQMLLTVYDNLFFNALKYGRTGGRIAWGCAMRPRGWEMFVTNEGQGVRPEALPRLLAVFGRAHSGEERLDHGTDSLDGRG